MREELLVSIVAELLPGNSVLPAINASAAVEYCRLNFPDVLRRVLDTLSDQEDRTQYVWTNLGPALREFYFSQGSVLSGLGLKERQTEGYRMNSTDWSDVLWAAK